jgi:hypothetical protein
MVSAMKEKTMQVGKLKMQVGKLKIAAIGVALLASALTASAALMRATPVEAGALAKAQAAWQGVGVIHAKFVAPNGSVVSEEWLDRRTGATKRVSYDHLRTGIKKHIAVQKGLTIVRWNSHARDVTYVARVFDRRDPWLASASQLLQVRRALESNQARVVGYRQQAVRGVVQIRLKPSRAPDDSQGTTLIAEVDRSTYLPVRLTLQAGGERTTVDVVAENLRSSRATKALFAVGRNWTIRDTKLRYADLVKRVPFPVYSFGRAYGRFALRGAGLHETTERNAEVRLQPQLFLAYGRDTGYAQPGLTLTEHAAGTADANARLAAFRAEGKAYRARIAGATRTVYVLDEDRRPIYFAVVVDRTLVKGNANLSRDALFAALSKLRLMT